ncbi:hypothetical protein DFH29DRAFT_879009 [Suillus ampliporus]|nr:hypothetical protein DFH29DRAFT_879009 [Suillus ampliporus]
MSLPSSDQELVHHLDQWMACTWPSNDSTPVDPDTYIEFYSNTAEQSHPRQTQGWKTPPDEPEWGCDTLLKNLFMPTEGSALTGAGSHLLRKARLVDGDFTGSEPAPAGDLRSILQTQRRHGVPNVSTTKLRLRFDPCRVSDRVDHRDRTPAPDPFLLVPALGIPINTPPQLQPMVQKGLDHLALVLLRMRGFMKHHVLKDGLGTNSGASNNNGLEEPRQSVDLFEWAVDANPAAKAEIDKMYQTVKFIKEVVRDVVQISTVMNYGIYAALASKPAADMIAFISQLTHQHLYLYGPVMVKGNMQTVAFGHEGIVNAAQYLLFSNHNFKEYIANPSQGLEALLIFIAFVEEWIFSQYSTGSFVDSSLTFLKDRRKLLLELETIFQSLDGHLRHALAVVIYTRGGYTATLGKQSNYLDEVLMYYRAANHYGRFRPKQNPKFGMEAQSHTVYASLRQTHLCVVLPMVWLSLARTGYVQFYLYKISDLI